MTVERVVYAWVIDAISTIFVDNEALDDAWAVAQGFTAAYPGLVTPDSLPARVNLRTLLPETTSAAIKLIDLDDSLAALFGSSPATSTDLLLSLEAGVTAPASLWNKHVGTERIGPAGERRRYSSVPGFEVGGRHVGGNEAFANGGDAAPVSDLPVLWTGRRCAVYRIKLIAGVWQDLADATRVWWGTLRGQGTQHMRTWSFSCHGPESWLGANLGGGSFEAGLRCIPATTLIEDGLAGQTVMIGSLRVISLSDGLDVLHTYVFNTDAIATNTTYLAGASTYDQVRAAVDSFLDDLIASVDNGANAFNKWGNDIHFETAPGQDGITIVWYRGDHLGVGDPYVELASNLRYTARLQLEAHEEVWRVLGYDVRLQNSDRDPVEDEEQYGQFSTTQGGYWRGSFYAANPVAMKGFETDVFLEQVTANDYSSGGFPRRWPPLYPGGAVTFTGQPGQEFQLVELDELRMLGSKSRPLMAEAADETTPRIISDGVGEVTHQGLLVLEGPYRRRGDQDQVDPVAGYAFEQAREQREGRTVQVFRVCWRSSSGLVDVDTDSLPRFVVYEVLDPRLFGFDYLPIDGTWAGFRVPPPDSEPIIARALTVWEYSDEGDRSASVLRRVMLTTGDAGDWFADPGLITPLYGLGGEAAYLDVGANDDGATVAGDAEVTAMGLAIPASMVAEPAVFDAAFVEADELGRCKMVAHGAAPAASLISGLLGPAGVAIGFSSGRFTPFDAWAIPSPDEAVAIITVEDYPGEPGKDPSGLIPVQQLRQFAPIDELELSARIEPIDGTYGRVLSRGSSDLGAAYRHDRAVKQTVKGDHLISHKIPVAGNDWPASVATRWRDGFAFWAEPNTVIKVPLTAARGGNIWPGDAIAHSDEWLLDTLGMYGVSVAAGRVIGRVHSPAQEKVTLDVMIGADTAWKLYAPSAVVTQYDEQELGPDFRLLCNDDELGDRGGESCDVDGFAEPAWSAEGGDADIELWQFEGDTNSWTGGIFGVVESVDGAFGSTSITLTGALTGAPFLSDRYTVVTLRNFANQGAAWVLRWHAPTCDELGQHSGGTPGSKWRGL